VRPRSRVASQGGTDASEPATAIPPRTTSAFRSLDRFAFANDEVDSQTPTGGVLESVEAA
jgi:hypothetical protein